MARLRQRNPQNYSSSGNINAEFESVIRYLNAAELGDKTVGELLSVLFDDDGEFDGPIEMRLDATEGLQYRVGEYDSAADGWLYLAALADLRGKPGRDVGNIGAPILFGRTDFVATSLQTVFTYAHDANDELIVYVNGVLQIPGVSSDYTSSAAADTITFNAGLTLSDAVTAYRIRATAITGFHREDFVTVSTQAVFAFVHDDTTVLQVYKNGILQREGGSYDYTTSPASDTVTFITPIASGNTVTIITVENTATTAVTGLMMEEDFCDPTTGKILYANLQLANGDIAQAKVSGLVTALAEAPKLTVASSTPTGPATGDLWVDTSSAPNVLKFYDGTEFLSTSPDSTLPSFTTSDASKYVAVNGAGTALEYQNLDLSSRIAVTQKAAANGVASLDSDGRLPYAQLPKVLAADNMYQSRTGSTANGTYTIERIYLRQIEVTGLSAVCASGTATIQLAINGVGVGSTYAVSSTATNNEFVTAQAADGSVATARVGFIITSATSLTDLEVTLAVRVVS